MGVSVMPDMLVEEDWDILLLQIKNGNCAPSLGSGDRSKKFPVSFRNENEWEKKFNYLLEDCFYELNIQVYCYDCREFPTKLKKLWEAFNRGI